MTLQMFKTQAIQLSTKQIAQLKGGTDINTDIIIFEDTDVV